MTINNDTLFDHFVSSHHRGRSAWSVPRWSRPGITYVGTVLAQYVRDDAPAEVITETDVQDPATVQAECGECGLQDYAADLVLQGYPHEGEYLCVSCHNAFIAEWEDQQRYLRRAV